MPNRASIALKHTTFGQCTIKYNESRPDMSKTQIKICGLTNLQQIQECIEIGVTWIGLNCYPKSPRYLRPKAIRELVAEIPEEVTTVGVFVNEPADNVEHILQYTRMQYAQLHGHETPTYVSALKVPSIKAFRVSDQFRLEEIAEYPQGIFLLDSYHPNLYGGTGDPFNWEIAKKAQQFGKFMLAGGLKPENVGKAVKQVQPFGVDVSSGVESSPGVKDLQKVRRFVEEVRKAEGE